jgi:hypothetical protein
MRGEYEWKRPQRREDKTKSRVRRWSPPGRKRGTWEEHQIILGERKRSFREGNIHSSCKRKYNERRNVGVELYPVGYPQ